MIAHGREGDALLAMSTSGNSANVIEALAEARRRGMLTIAMVGYDGGRVAEDGLADHVVVTRSEHIPRIQEAQASAWHVLRELMEVRMNEHEQDAAAEPSEVAHGALRGVIAAMAMTGMRAFTISVGLVDEPPPRAILRQKSKGLFRVVPEEEAPRVPGADALGLRRHRRRRVRCSARRRARSAPGSGRSMACCSGWASSSSRRR